MNYDLLPIMVAFLAVMYLFYWQLIFLFLGTICEHPRGSKLWQIPIGLVCALITLATSSLVGGSTYSYIAFFCFLALGLRILYTDGWASILLCASACLMHVMAIRAIVTALFSIGLDRTIYEVANEPLLFVSSITVATVVTNLAVMTVMRFLPASKIRIVNQHKEQQWYMNAWLLVFNLYLLHNASVFSQPDTHPSLIGNELIAPLAILTGLYIMIFFAFKNSVLLGYEEKSVELEQAVYREQQFRNAATQDALATYEVNLTQNLIVHGCEDKEAELGTVAQCYTDMIAFETRRLIYSEDVEGFIKYAHPANLLRVFNSGKSETVVDYRRLLPSGDYIWVRAVTNLTRNKETGDVLAFVCIKNIHGEKQRQLALQYRAERDPLTGLYNKEMTGKLINEKLRFFPERTFAALFMIDVDRFKEINDHFGHVYGDGVLCELAGKLKQIFRSDDIVGRIGGDEYIAFMESGATVARVEKKAALICEAFYSTYLGENEVEYIISGSVGVALAPTDGTSFEELYHHADIALYAAKARGKNTFAFYESTEQALY